MNKQSIAQRFPVGIDVEAHACYSCGRRFPPAQSPARASAHVRWRIHIINNHGAKVVSSICHAACDGLGQARGAS